jgi:hypothetical protein
VVRSISRGDVATAQITLSSLWVLNSSAKIKIDGLLVTTVLFLSLMRMLPYLVFLAENSVSI